MSEEGTFWNRPGARNPVPETQPEMGPPEKVDVIVLPKSPQGINWSPTPTTAWDSGRPEPVGDDESKVTP